MLVMYCLFGLFVITITIAGSSSRRGSYSNSGNNGNDNILQQIEQFLLSNHDNHTIISICYQRYTVIINIYDKYNSLHSLLYDHSRNSSSNDTTSNDVSANFQDDYDVIDGSCDDDNNLVMYKNNRCHAYFIGYPPDCVK